MRQGPTQQPFYSSPGSASNVCPARRRGLAPASLASNGCEPFGEISRYRFPAKDLRCRSATAVFRRPGSYCPTQNNSIVGSSHQGVITFRRKPGQSRKFKIRLRSPSSDTNPMLLAPFDDPRPKAQGRTRPVVGDFHRRPRACALATAEKMNSSNGIAGAVARNRSIRGSKSTAILAKTRKLGESPDV